jgi:Mn-dependent DtxR family transcriptional regulator
MEEQLSTRQRFLLTYIKYRTNNHRIFFASNEDISKHIGYTLASTKTIVNKLIREGYIIKEYDKKKRRVLTLSKKPFEPLDGVNLGNVEKRLLKQDVEYYKDTAQEYKRELNEAQATITRQSVELSRLRQENFELGKRLMEATKSVFIDLPKTPELYREPDMYDDGEYNEPVIQPKPAVIGIEQSERIIGKPEEEYIDPKGQDGATVLAQLCSKVCS